MRKKLISVLVALCMVLALLPGSALAADTPPTSGSCGDNAQWHYNQSTGTVIISGSGDIGYFEDFYYDNYEKIKAVNFNGNFTAIDYMVPLTNITSIEIPSGITRLNLSIFWDCPLLSHIVIPASVTEIGGSFSNCPLLTSAGPIGSGCNIEFGWTTRIPSFAFSGCTELAEVTIPNTITGIDGFAFSGCSKLKEIIIPSGVKTIKNCVFSDCSSLSKVTIPDTVTSIESAAFVNCSALKEITIPKGVIRIDGGAFEGCDSLEKFFVSSDNNIYSADDGVLLRKEGPKLIVCLCPYAKTSYEIPFGVTSIGEWAFSSCKLLASVKIPDSVSNIEYGAFSECSGLANVEIPNGVTNIGWHAFSDCTSLTHAVVSESVTDIGWDAFSGCTQLSNVVIRDGENTLSLGGNVFSGCSSLGAVSLPSRLTRIGQNAFSGCFGLKVAYAGNETQWDKISIDSQNQELYRAPKVYNTTSFPSISPDPDTPVTPGKLALTSSKGGLGTKVTAQVTGGHWLTIQTQRAGAISITAIQAPGSGGLVPVSFSAPAGSKLQVWETENELTFTDGVPSGVILNKGTIDL